MERLYRNKKDSKIAGVCTGIGDYFEIDPVIVRLLFILRLVMGGSGLIVYVIAWIIVPMGTQKKSEFFTNYPTFPP